MESFAASAISYISKRPTARSRGAAWSDFEAVGLPTTSDEVWRYAPLHAFDLDRYRVAHEPSILNDSVFATELRQRAGAVIHVVDGFCVDSGGLADGVSIEVDETSSWTTDSVVREHYANDAFAMLNYALAPATTVIHVDAGVTVESPIVVLNVANASSSFSRTRIELGRGASATVVEYFEGGRDALVVPLSEYVLAENSRLQLVTYQRLDPTSWQIARTTGFLAREARLHQAVIGIGAHYDRSRNDAVMNGIGAENELRTTFMGSSDQVHDFRTHQFHDAPRTRSTLLSKGAVADESRSVYTGLIEIEKGAKRTDARQTNHNLLLSRFAHADSVPNLDIRENDVVCAHASSVGPLNELQRWYLESRGVPRHEAERLMIQGFFNEMLVAMPSGIAELVERDVTTVLATVNLVAS
jgi:Fe-S cluster assembly protein SufD